MSIDLCPNKDRCGSCSWSHISYEDQLATKLGEIRKALSSVTTELSCDSIIPSPTTSHYRNRMDFTINFEGLFGLREKGKWWRTIDGHHCFIADKEIEKAFTLIKNWLPDAGLSYYDRKAHKGLLRYATIRATREGQVMVTIITSDCENRAEVQTSLEQLAKISPFETVVWAINKTQSDTNTADELIAVKGSGTLVEQIGGVDYIIDPLSFFQSNSHTAEILQGEVLKICNAFHGKRILDLYCGSGFFTIPLAQRAQSVLGVELVEDAIIRARATARLNNVEVQFEAAKAEESPWEAFEPEVVVVDPPRGGMHPKALDKLLQCAPKELIYVSCNYRSLAKELPNILKSYEMKFSVAIDMFPHTPHVELVTHFSTDESPL